MLSNSRTAVNETIFLFCGNPDCWPLTQTVLLQLSKRPVGRILFWGACALTEVQILILEHIACKVGLNEAWGSSAAYCPGGKEKQKEKKSGEKHQYNNYNISKSHSSNFMWHIMFSALHTLFVLVLART